MVFNSFTILLWIVKGAITFSDTFKAFKCLQLMFWPCIYNKHKLFINFVYSCLFLFCIRYCLTSDHKAGQPLQSGGYTLLIRAIDPNQHTPGAETGLPPSQSVGYPLGEWLVEQNVLPFQLLLKQLLSGPLLEGPSDITRILILQLTTPELWSGVHCSASTRIAKCVTNYISSYSKFIICY